VVLDNKDIFEPDVDVVQLRKKVGMVFQQPNPFPKSIFENVAYGPRIHGTHGKSDLDDIVEESLRRAALWDEVKDNVHKSAMALSGGQQQRLCIARSLAVEPHGLPGQPQQVPVIHVFLRIRAMTGSRRGALRAGRMPKISPTEQDTPSAAGMPHAGGWIGNSKTHYPQIPC